MSVTNSEIEPAQDGPLSIWDFLGGPKRPFTPLFVVLGFLALITYFAFGQLANVDRDAQIAIIGFVAALAILTVGGFFYVVVRHPFHWYPPSEWAGTPDPKIVVDAVQPRVTELTVTRTISIDVPQTVESEVASGAEGGPPELSLPPGGDEETVSIEQEYFLSFFEEPIDLVRSEQLFRQALEEIADQKRRVQLRLFNWITRLRHGDSGALVQLEEFVRSDAVPPEMASEAWNRLGVAYLTAGSFQRAEQAYSNALQLASSESDRVLSTINMAHCLSRLRRGEQATQLLKDVIATTCDDQLLADLYDRLAQLYQEAERPLLRALALDKALQHRPEATDRRFEAARAYDESRIDELAFLHYKRLLQIDSDNSAALNNIGVQFAELGMSGLAVDFYRKAYEFGETLGAANIAYLYMKSGFLIEAQSILEEASTQSDPHPNVARARAAIADQREEEEKADESMLNTAREMQDFLLKYAEIVFAADQHKYTFDGTWSLVDGTLVGVKLESSTVIASWMLDRRVYTLTGSAQGPAVTIERITSKIPDNEWSYELVADGGYGYVSPEGTSAHIMATKDRKATFTSFGRVRETTGSAIFD